MQRTTKQIQRLPGTTAIVSGWRNTSSLPDFISAPSRETLGLRHLDALVALVEAYVLHDNVIYFPHDLSFPSDFDIEVARSLPSVQLSPRELSKVGDFSPFLSPLLPSDLANESIDLAKFGIVLRHFWQRKVPREFLPSRPRHYDDWLSLSSRIEGELLRAEIKLCENLDSTYYPDPWGASVLHSIGIQFESSAVPLLRQFTNLRSRQLAEVQTLLRPQSIELSPPLLFAYAVNSSENLKGLKHVIHEMHEDTQMRRLRSFIDGFAKCSPAEQIDRARSLVDQLHRILGVGRSSVLDIGRIVQSVPAVASGATLAKLAELVLKLIDPRDVIEQLTVGRHLAILRKVHRTVPSVSGFYHDMKRVFRSLNFSEEELRAWLTHRRIRQLVGRGDDTVLRQKTHRIIDRVNSLIQNSDKTSGK